MIYIEDILNELLSIRKDINFILEKIYDYGDRLIQIEKIIKEEKGDIE